MKLLIDLQGCQTASQFRGIGRYSAALAQGIVRNAGEHEIVLLANGAFSEGIESLRAQFLPHVSERNFIVFDSERPVAEIDPGNAVRARLAEIERERLISSIAPDAVLLTSLFEGFVDDAVTSIGTTGSRPVTAVVLYDLIPYLSPDPNWPPNYKDYYDRKIKSLLKSDRLLSISRYSGDEAANAIPGLTERIVNMSSACDTGFLPADLPLSRKLELQRKYTLTRPFVMSSGIIEPRKNHKVLLQAFAALPKEITSNLQLVFVGGGEEWLIKELQHLAAALGLYDGQLVFTGHVPNEELIDLYRLCELFVFPSKYEGFGLPPLEAMSCGAVVIGANTTSIPEVIGREDALFDPLSVDELCNLMMQTLTDTAFRKSLQDHGLLRAKEFSWDRTARIALDAIVHAYNKSSKSQSAPQSVAPTDRPRLAMVSPLPPEQTGIADYMAELLPELAKVYEVTVISNQKTVLPGPNGEIFTVKPVNWFEMHAATFERIVYQVGNSPFHAHMLDLLVRYPGVVVLHDFFISSLKLWKEKTGYCTDAFRKALLYSHGYAALSDIEKQCEQTAKFRWPCSLPAVNAALGIIVHSQYSKELVAKYYGNGFKEKVTVVRHHRAPAPHVTRAEARKRLGVATDTFLVCAFGFMDLTKLNHVLLQAWAASALANDASCRLVFVGGRAEPDYAHQIDASIERINNGESISITGFATKETFTDYLAAADVAVQLRTLSRGETSGTVLDCLAHGVPLIINAHGPVSEYSDDILIKLPDEFSVTELTNALELLHRDESTRKKLSQCGKDYIANLHAPCLTVQGYADVIERVTSSSDCQQTANAVHDFWQSTPPLSFGKRKGIASKLVDLLHSPRRPKIYLDVSATTRNDLKTGIERVARALLNELLISPPHGYLVVPVYLVEEQGQWRVRKANTFLSRQPGYSLVPQDDELVIPGCGDLLLALDLFTEGVCAAEQQGLYTYWKAAGAGVGFLVFDILPVTHPEFFPPWAANMHENWLHSISRAAGQLVCISRHVQEEVEKWLSHTVITKKPIPKLESFQLGADVSASLPSNGLQEDAANVLAALSKHPTFLMVGTIEPRKGHLQTIAAFELLWQQGVEINLVIVGREGWIGLPDTDRRTIPKIINNIQRCPNLGKRLFWLDGISDEYLDKIYAASDCLIAASEDEGFGLPLIEAAQHNLPIIARDILVFREVAGEYAFYFGDNVSPQVITDAVKEWLNLYQRNQHQKSDNMPWLTWKDSANALFNLLISEELKFKTKSNDCQIEVL